MLIVKTPGMTLQRDVNDLVAATSPHGQAYLKFADNVEVIIPTNVDSTLIDNALRIASQSSSKITVTLDFTNPKQIVSLG